MTNENIATLIGFIALVLVVISYFVHTKSKYLLFQALNMLALALSYLFSAEYFAMVGISVSMARTITFFLFSKKEKKASIAWSFLFAFLNLLAYFIINFVVLEKARAIDIMYVISLVAYSFIFRIKDMKLVRYLMVIPLILSIIFNALSNATIFAVLSYVIELVADIVAIIKGKISENNSKKEQKVNL
ncbi:MAG: YgjV family protein [Clostridia bacterium]|nr:YgjV family protein [Clostridia bacterium]